jgi:hypothetical protein
MLLVLLAVVMAAVLSLSFLSAQATTRGISENVKSHVSAREIAESGLNIVAQHLKANSAWRTTFHEGVWITNQALAGGTFTVTGVDGAFVNGVLQGDGSLSDASNDPVTITVRGTFDGVTHTTRATMYEVRRLLMIVQPGALSAADVALKALFAADGWTVSTIADSASDATYSAALHNTDAVYITGNASAAAINTRLNNYTVGIVSENPGLADDLGLIAPGDATVSGTTITLSGTSHFLQRNFGGTSVSLASLSTSLNHYTGAVAGDVIVLATASGSATPTMLAIDAGGTDFGDRFVITGGNVVPQIDFGARVTIVGAFISTLPVTVQIRAGNQTYEPFGPFATTATGNVNDNHNPRNFVLPTELPSGTTLAIKAKSWSNASNGLLTVDSNISSPNVKVLRNGDAVPQIPGAAGQMSVAQVLTPYINAQTNKITLTANQAIYLFELYTTNLNSQYADFQDLVVVVTLGTSRASISGTSPARRLFLPFGRNNPGDLTENGRELLRRSVEWARQNRNGGYVTRWAE